MEERDYMTATPHCLAAMVSITAHPACNACTVVDAPLLDQSQQFWTGIKGLQHWILSLTESRLLFLSTQDRSNLDPGLKSTRTVLKVYVRKLHADAVMFTLTSNLTANTFLLVCFGKPKCCMANFHQVKQWTLLPVI